MQAKETKSTAYSDNIDTELSNLNDGIGSNMFEQSLSSDQHLRNTENGNSNLNAEDLFKTFISDLSKKSLNELPEKGQI